MQPALLPEATIDCFWGQNYTAETLNALRDDWRFARVTLRSDKGDIDDAIARYRNNPSPSLLIIETDRADEVFIHRLGALAACCTEDTAALFIGPDKDRDFYHQLKNLGVADYLQRPVEVEAAIESIARILTGRLGFGLSRLIAVAGSVDGAGTTRLTQAIAQSLSQFLNEKCSVLGGMADAVSGEVLLQDMRQREANIVADLSAYAPDVRGMLMQQADALVLVTTPEQDALKTTADVLKIARADVGPDGPIFVVVNKTQGADAAETEAQITKALGEKPFVMIPQADTIFTAIETASPLNITKSVQPLAEFLAPLASALAGKPAMPLKTSLVAGSTGSLLKLLGGK